MIFCGILVHKNTKRNLENMIKQLNSNTYRSCFGGYSKQNIFSSHAEFYDDLAKQYNLLLDDSSIAKLEKVARI